MPGVRSRQLDEAFRAGRTLRWLRHGSALGKSLELQQQGLREQRAHPCGIEPGGDAGCSQEGATGRAATVRSQKRWQSSAYCSDGRWTGPSPCLRGSCVRAAVRLGTDACRGGRLCVCWRRRFDPLWAHRRAPAGCHGRRPTVPVRSREAVRSSGMGAGGNRQVRLARGLQHVVPVSSGARGGNHGRPSSRRWTVVGTAMSSACRV